MSRKKMEPKETRKHRFEPRYKQEMVEKSETYILKKENLDLQEENTKIQGKSPHNVIAKTQHPNEAASIKEINSSIQQIRVEMKHFRNHVNAVDKKIGRANESLWCCLLVIFTYLSILGFLIAFIFGPRFLWNLEAETISAQITGHKVSLRMAEHSAIIAGDIFVNFPVQNTLLELPNEKKFETDIECSKYLNLTYPINTPIRLYYSPSDSTDIRFHRNSLKWDVVIGTPVVSLILGIGCLVDDDMPVCGHDFSLAILFLILGCFFICIYIGLFLAIFCGNAICGPIDKIMNYELGKKSADEGSKPKKSKAKLQYYNVEVTA